MPKGTNQKLKLLYLMQILQERTDESHGLTMQEIIDGLKAYDVTAERKSIYTDIELLVDAIQSSKFITEKKSNELIKKLESEVSKYDAKKLQRQVYVSGRIKTIKAS